MMLRRTSALSRRLSTSAYDPHALLHSSRIPTSHFQDSLPKLGVPKLEDTLKRFLYSAEPVVSAEALAEATALAAEFGKGEGAVLHGEGEERPHRPPEEKVPRASAARSSAARLRAQK